MKLMPLGISSGGRRRRTTAHHATYAGHATEFQKTKRKMEPSGRHGWMAAWRWQMDWGGGVDHFWPMTPPALLWHTLEWGLGFSCWAVIFWEEGRRRGRWKRGVAAGDCDAEPADERAEVRGRTTGAREARREGRRPCRSSS